MIHRRFGFRPGLIRAGFPTIAPVNTNGDSVAAHARAILEAEQLMHRSWLFIHFRFRYCIGYNFYLAGIQTGWSRRTRNNALSQQ
jgi:hypothetical protein